MRKRNKWKLGAENMRNFAIVLCLLSVSILVYGKIHWDNKIQEMTARAQEHSKKQTEQENNEQSLEPVEISPTNKSWLYTNGAWKQIDLPGWGNVMQGWLYGKDGQQYGRRAHISTNSTFATLKQRGIGGNVSIYVDGKLVVTKELPNDGSLVEIPIYKDSTGWRHIELVYSLHSEVDGLYISKDAEVKAPKINKKKLVVIGHSYAEGSNSTDIGSKSFVALLGDKLGVESVNQAIGGTDVNKSYPEGKKNSGLDRVKIDVIDEKPDYILVVYGLNVTSDIKYKGTMTHQQYREDFKKFLQTIRNDLPNVAIFVSGIISIPGWSDQALSPFNKDIQVAVSQVSNTKFIDLSGLWNSSNYSKYLSSDKVHPNDEGHKFLAEKYAEAIKPYLK